MYFSYEWYNDYDGSNAVIGKVDESNQPGEFADDDGGLGYHDCRLARVRVR